MAAKEPVAELDARFSAESATARPWSEGDRRLDEAELYWLSTVRPDGRPHVTPLLCVWLGGTLYFCTGETERKARNLAVNPHCILMTGCNSLHDGLDVVVEGDAVRVTDDTTLERIADAYEVKYGSDWQFDVRDNAFVHAQDPSGGSPSVKALVFEVAPVTAFGFAKGAYGQTRWSFAGA